MARQTKNSMPTTQATSERGFSLIELLIVVAVILIIAGIAIPNFIRSKMRANEASAVSNIRTITTAEVAYSTTYAIGFSPSLVSLEDDSSGVVDQNHASLIDQVLASGQKSGYLFSYTVVNQDAQGNVTDYAINADPMVPNSTGTRHFYSDESGVIRENDSTMAGSSDSPLQ